MLHVDTLLFKELWQAQTWIEIHNLLPLGNCLPTVVTLGVCSQVFIQLFSWLTIASINMKLQNEKHGWKEQHLWGIVLQQCISEHSRVHNFLCFFQKPLIHVYLENKTYKTSKYFLSKFTSNSYNVLECWLLNRLLFCIFFGTNPLLVIT